jgi:hypothetical protein
MQAIKWLEKRGYSGRIWRAAFMQQQAPQHTAVQKLMLAYATPTDQGYLQPYPFEDRYGIPRMPLHAYSPTDFDTFFAQLKTTNEIMVCYTHKVNNGVAADITPANWAYFLSKVDQAIAEGWLEGVTLEMLLARDGFKFRRGFGDYFAEYMGDTGTTVTVKLP